MINTKLQSERRRRRVRAKISGTTDRPRLSVRVTNRHVIAQLVDDTKAQTVAYVTTASQELKGGLAERANWAGEAIAKTAKQKKITRVVFDRGGKVYSKRLQVLAEAARKGGLEF